MSRLASKWSANLLRLRYKSTFNNAFTLRDRVGKLTAGAREIVAGWTQPDTLVVVTHGANILPLTGEMPEEGGMVIVKPDPSSAAKLRTLGHISCERSGTSRRCP